MVVNASETENIEQRTRPRRKLDCGCLAFVAILIAYPLSIPFVYLFAQNTPLWMQGFWLALVRIYDPLQWLYFNVEWVKSFYDWYEQFFPWWQ